MSSLIFAFNSVAPVFLLVFLGWIARRIRMADEQFIKTAGRVNFYFGLPALIFTNILQTNVGKTLSWGFIAFAVGFFLVLAVVLFFTVPRFVKDPRRASAVVHTIFKPNVIILGYSIAQTMLGPEHMGPMTMIFPFIIPANNIAAVFILSAFNAENQEGGTQRLKKTAMGIAKNPLIFAALAALAIQLFQITPPAFLTKSISTLSGMAIPLALVTLGAQLKREAVARNLKCAAFCTAFRLVISPLLMVPLALLLGFTGDQLAALFIIAASPSAVNSYVLAKEMNSDDELTGQVVVMSTFFSMFSLFAGITLLKSMGLLS